MPAPIYASPNICQPQYMTAPIYASPNICQPQYMPAPYVLAVDVGSSALKASLMAPDGAVVAGAYTRPLLSST